MKKNIIILMLFIIATSVKAFSQTPFSDASITYNLKLDLPPQQQQLASKFEGSTLIWSIKGNLSKKEINLGQISNTTITDMKDTTAVVMIETSGNKYLIHLKTQDILDYMQRKYGNMEFKEKAATKTIAGYQCKKAEATLPDGKVITVYYAPSLIPEDNEYKLQFKGLDGFPLEFETYLRDGKTKMTATATTVNLNTVPAAVFDVPSGGYRELTPQELHNMSH